MARCIVKTTGINGCARYMLGYTTSSIMWTSDDSMATVFDDEWIDSDFRLLHPRELIEVMPLSSLDVAEV